MHSELTELKNQIELLTGQIEKLETSVEFDGQQFLRKLQSNPYCPVFIKNLTNIELNSELLLKESENKTISENDEFNFSMLGYVRLTHRSGIKISYSSYCDGETCLPNLYFETTLPINNLLHYIQNNNYYYPLIQYESDTHYRVPTLTKFSYDFGLRPIELINLIQIIFTSLKNHYPIDHMTNLIDRISSNLPKPVETITYKTIPYQKSELDTMMGTI